MKDREESNKLSEPDKLPRHLGRERMLSVIAVATSLIGVFSSVGMLFDLSVIKNWLFTHSSIFATIIELIVAITIASFTLKTTITSLYEKKNPEKLDKIEEFLKLKELDKIRKVKRGK